MRITIIQCTNSKRDSPSFAQNLYDESAYFKKMREWAKARGNPWYVLSAKHGLLHPETTVEPYDDRGVSETLAEETAEDIDALGADVVDITAGRDYTDHLIPALERRGIDVINHFAGLGIGERQAALEQATHRIINDSQ